MYQSRWADKPTDEEKTRDRSVPSGTTTSDSQPKSPQAPSSLSAAAPSFSPAPAPAPDVSSLDTFAQTGARQDDLFDDVVPVDDSMRVRSEDDLFSDDFTPVEQPVVEQPAPQQPRVREDGGRGRGRGRGRGVAPQARGGANRNAQPTPAQQDGQNQAQAQQQLPVPENAPTGPRKDPTASVRGDRQATGGVRKPKLTEEQLAEKMAAIQIKNASLTAAHARAEADAANFAEREEEAKTKAALKQKEERRDRQQMMGERERNRMRKLKAMEGREWDAEKNEDDFQRGGRSDMKGGFVGDQEGYSDGREYLYKEPRGGQRGGGTAGRGGKAQEQSTPKQDDFPALPAANKADTTSQTQKEAADAAGNSWADQVESSNAT
ncbi:hypothetical protein LTR37_016250 [Vermiconidia calcicola]|uniref:Uncharacterized protein n=1 Tax=Vermiconidia calcicola TaxID=1690605 RepID=A0ACC3MPK6_9PEZI|nr:hypothetical protein LTR37_016250 [Vermiconidia calcicola]